MNEGPVLIHIWEVDPAHEPAALQSLNEMFGQIATDPGFVSARVLESPDRTSLAAFVEMRTVEDRQRLEQLPDVRDTLHHLHGAANLVIRLYHQVDAYSITDRRPKRAPTLENTPSGTANERATPTLVRDAGRGGESVWPARRRGQLMMGALAAPS